MVTWTSNQQRGVNAICSDAQSLLACKGLSMPAIKAYDRLVDKPEFWVGRLSFRQNHALKSNSPKSLVLKHIPPEHYLDDVLPVSTSLQEETLAYRFLSTLDPEFDRLPRLFGEKTGLLVLEHLKEIQPGISDPVPTCDDYLEKVSDTLVQLHVNCAGRRSHYEKLRNEIGLPVYSGVAYPRRDEWFGFLEGMKIWQSWAVFFGLPKLQWHNLVKNVHEIMFSPGPFATFIHTELASPRNAVHCQRGLCLIDFERSCYGHALLDIAIVMIGHIAWHKKRKGYFLRHLDADMDFAELYRRQWAELGGEKISDKHWRTAMAATLIFTAGLATGAAQRAEHRYDAVQPLSQVILDIIKRLCGNLSVLGYFTELKETLDNISIMF